MRLLWQALIAAALMMMASQAVGEQRSGFNYICPETDPTQQASAGACTEYLNSFTYIRELIDVFDESTKFIQQAAGMEPPVQNTDFLLIPREMLNPERLGEFPPGQLAVGSSRAANIGTNAEIVNLRENINARLFAVPALYRIVADKVTSVIDHGCASWFYNPVLATVSQYNASRYTGISVLDYIRQTGNTPQLGNSLMTPDGRAPASQLDAAGEELTLTCATDPADGSILRSANAVSSAWSIFYDQMASHLLGDGVDGTARTQLLLGLISEMPRVETLAFGSARAEHGTVLALHRMLSRRYTDRGLTEIYPETMARFLDPDRPELLALNFFSRRAGDVLRVDLGETVERKDQRVKELGTTPYVALLERGSAEATRRLVVDVTIPPEYVLTQETIEDVHIIVNGEVYSDSLGLVIDPDKPTIRAVITLDDPRIDRVYIGVAQVPEVLDPATIIERLSGVNYDLEVTLEEVDLCDIALFNDFTNPRLAAASGNIGNDGRPNLPWLSQELGPRTQSTISFVSPERAVSDATVCVDQLAAAQSGAPVISFYTPSPLTLMGGGFAGLTVAHGGWEGWPANSTFKLTVVLPGVTVNDLEAGRTYRAVLPEIMSEGFSAIYTDYDGRFTGPGPNDFEGQSSVLVAKGAQGFFIVEEAESGFLRGDLTIVGPAEFITWEHTRLDDGRYMMDGDTEQSTLSISGEITVEATEDSLNFLREGGSVKSAVIE